MQAPHIHGWRLQHPLQPLGWQTPHLPFYLDSISMKRLSLINKDGQHTWRQAQHSWVPTWPGIHNRWNSRCNTDPQGTVPQSQWPPSLMVEYSTTTICHLPSTHSGFPEEQTFIAFIQNKWAHISLLSLGDIPDAIQEASELLRCQVWATGGSWGKSGNDKHA